MLYYIDQIHVEESSYCSEIVTLKYSEDLDKLGEQECTKQEMINHLRANPHTVKTKYKGLGDAWYEGETVLVSDGCYLRTDSCDEIGDKLDNLIKY